MGRVYNAMVKAERTQGHHPLIGRGAHVEADQQVFPDDNQSVRILKSAFDNAPANSGFDIYNDIATSESITVSQRQEIRVSPPPQVAPTSAAMPAPAFVEPETVANANRLNLESQLAALHCEDLWSRERYRALAVRLLDIALNRKLKTVLVTSSGPREGKTTVALNLAWCLARPAQRRVLLLESDAVGSGFSRQLEAETGWIDVAERRSSLASALTRVDPNGLYVVRPGAASPPDELLLSPAFQKLLGELECKFDFIIIDGPQILESASAQHLASIADGTILVVQAGRTHHREVSKAIDLVVPERRLGVILNEAEVDDRTPRERKRKSR